MKRKLLLGLICCSVWISVIGQKLAPSHEMFTGLLQKHVSVDGRVNYKGFVKDSVLFNKYLKTLSNNPPNPSWSSSEVKAFWINAYNAFTIKLIIDNYPVKSIKDLGGWIYKVNTPWDIKFIMIGSEKMDLNNIEHGKLRREFNDARIHFAIVCASKSCPKLLNEAFVANRLDQQLGQAGRDFLGDTFRNKITADKIELSSIFKWYRGDFTKEGSLIDFVNKFSSTKINKNASVSFLDYDWTLNE